MWSQVWMMFSTWTILACEHSLVYQYQAPDFKQELGPADPHKMNTVEEIWWFQISFALNSDQAEQNIAWFLNPQPNLKLSLAMATKQSQLYFLCICGTSNSTMCFTMLARVALVKLLRGVVVNEEQCFGLGAVRQAQDRKLSPSLPSRTISDIHEEDDNTVEVEIFLFSDLDLKLSPLYTMRVPDLLDSVLASLWVLVKYVI